MIKRIIFLGNNVLAVRVLRYLKSQPQELVGLVIHPQNGSKRRQGLIDISGLPKERIFDGTKINQPLTAKKLASLKPDLLVSVLFGYLLKPEVLTIPKYGAVNLHLSYLPYNRGTYPNIWAIIEGTRAGVTLHYIDAGMDTGDILAQEKVLIGPTDTAKTLYHRLEDEAYKLFVTAWPLLAKGKLRSYPQAGTGTAHKDQELEKIDEIDLNKHYTGKEVINLLRARTFPPYKAVYFKSNGKKVYIRVSLKQIS